VGHGFSPPPTAAKANESWAELDDAKKTSFFESFKKELNDLPGAEPVGVEVAERVLKELLRTWQINSQGAASKKLREFSLRFDYHIDGLSAPSSSSSSAFAGNKRARLAALLEESVMLSEQLGKKVSRAQLYTFFEM